jgi:uncharacterized protein YbcI
MSGAHPQNAAHAATGGHPQAAIANAVVRILADYTGRGPTRARTIMNGDWVFVTLQDALTKGERKLAEIGRGDFVLDSRKAFQNAMREELSLEVQRITGRKVIAFMSDNHLEPDVGLEAMMLEPDLGAGDTRDPA